LALTARGSDARRWPRGVVVGARRNALPAGSVHVRSGRISYRPKLGRLQKSQNKPTISEVHLQAYPDWWRGFHDPDLNQLTQIAFDQNLTLLSAGTRVLQASAALEIAVGISHPQVQQGRLCGNHVTRSPMNVLPCHEYQGASLSAPLTSRFSKSASRPSSDKVHLDKVLVLV
jgi:hypothetical protein